MSKSIIKNVRVLQELKVHKSDITCIEFWGNVLLVTGSSDKSVRLWKWTVGSGFEEDDKSPLLGHTYGVTCIKISPQGGVLASGSVDGTIILWDLSNGDKTETLYQENGEAIRSCTFSPNGSYIAAADDSGTICLWDHNKSLIRSFHYHEETIYTIAFSPDSNIIFSGCNTGMIRLSKPVNETGDYECGIDNAHDLGVTSGDFCKLIYSDPTDSDTSIYTLATCGVDQAIKIWRIYCLMSPLNGRRRSRLVPRKGEHESGSSVVYHKSTMNAECVLIISAHGSSLTCVRFNHRGTMLMSCGLDKTIKLWDLQGNLLQTLAEHTRYVNCVTMNEDSTILASGSNDRRIILWDLTSTLTLDSRITGLRSMIFALASNQVEIPLELICPITHEIMTNPVMAEDGFSYEKSAIQEWFDGGKTKSPMTNAELEILDVIDDTRLKEKIENFLRSMDFDNYSNIDVV